MIVVEGTERRAPALGRRKLDKGHRELLVRFVEHVRGRAAEPIPWAEIAAISRFVLELDRESRGSAPDG